MLGICFRFFVGFRTAKIITIFNNSEYFICSCISGSTQVTIHAVEVSADPKSPRFGAGPREDTPGLYVDWAIEDSGLCKGDRYVPKIIMLSYRRKFHIVSNNSDTIYTIINSRV